MQQYVQKQTDRQQAGWKPSVSLPELPDAIFKINPARFSASCLGNEQAIFQYTLDYTRPIDWHLDLSTGKRLPLTYAKQVDVQSGQFGEVRYVWEVNRMQFLPTLALQYRLTGDEQYLQRLVEMISSWEAANPYLMGVNWNSNREVNIRLINWFICWNILDASALARTNAAFGQFVEATWLPSIYQHCIYSRANPSFYSTTNTDLIAEYAGLFIASSFWAFPESTAWNQFARKGLEQEIFRPHRVSYESIRFIADLLLSAFVTGLNTGRIFSDEFGQQLEHILFAIDYYADEAGKGLPGDGSDPGRLWGINDRKPVNTTQSLLASASVLFFNPSFKQQAHEFDLRSQLLFGDPGRKVFEAFPVKKTAGENDLTFEPGLYDSGKRFALDEFVYS